MNDRFARAVPFMAAYVNLAKRSMFEALGYENQRLVGNLVDFCIHFGQPVSTTRVVKAQDAEPGAGLFFLGYSPDGESIYAAIKDPSII
jgi:hypothetical protein